VHHTIYSVCRAHGEVMIMITHGARKRQQTPCMVPLAGPALLCPCCRAAAAHSGDVCISSVLHRPVIISTAVCHCVCHVNLLEADGSTALCCCALLCAAVLCCVLLMRCCCSSVCCCCTAVRCCMPMTPAAITCAGIWPGSLAAPPRPAHRSRPGSQTPHVVVCSHGTLLHTAGA
jgi:hypothetical protein